MNRGEQPKGETGERLLNVDEMLRLEARLACSPAVARYDDEIEGAEANRLALALSDIEDSLRAIRERHLPQLAAGDIGEDALSDALQDIKDELGHVLYHVYDSRYFRDLFDLYAGGSEDAVRAK